MYLASSDLAKKYDAIGQARRLYPRQQVFLKRLVFGLRQARDNRGGAWQMRQRRYHGIHKNIGAFVWPHTTKNADTVGSGQPRFRPQNVFIRRDGKATQVNTMRHDCRCVRHERGRQWRRADYRIHAANEPTRKPAMTVLGCRCKNQLDGQAKHVTSPQPCHHFVITADMPYTKITSCWRPF